MIGQRVVLQVDALQLGAGVVAGRKSAHLMKFLHLIASLFTEKFGVVGVGAGQQFAYRFHVVKVALSFSCQVDRASWWLYGKRQVWFLFCLVGSA